MVLVVLCPEHENAEPQLLVLGVRLFCHRPPFALHLPLFLLCSLTDPFQCPEDFNTGLLMERRWNLIITCDPSVNGLIMDYTVQGVSV